MAPNKDKNSSNSRKCGLQSHLIEKVDILSELLLPGANLDIHFDGWPLRNHDFSGGTKKTGWNLQF